MKKMITTCRNQRRRILWFIVLMCFLYLTGNLISICTYGRKDETCKADVVIVLGAAAYQDDVSPVYRERLNHGIDLYQQGYVEKIIVTGGLAEGNQHSDAYTAMQYVISRGISEEDILMEEKSSITQENLENAKKLMDQNGYRRAVIVSDPLHMKRAMLLAEDAGIQAFSSPTPTTMYHSLKTKIPFLARELFYYMGYKGYRILVLDQPEMDFQPILDRAARTNAVIIETDQHQVFGRMTGKAVLDDQTVIEVKDMMCFAEDVHNRY